MLLIYVCLFGLLHGFELDNSLADKPHVDCGIDNVVVHLITQSPFKGRLYVQGESERDECIKTTENPTDELNFELAIGACNMRRQRTLHPRGVSFSFTLVVSFHPMFVTANDKAFNVRCFFLESVRSLNTEVDVGQLTTQVVEQEFPLPDCTYQLRDGFQGEVLRFAQIGQKVTHVWQCAPSVDWVYGVLIHSCFADDGHGNKFMLVDDRGCTTDSSLLPQIQYESTSTTAYTHSQVFKYADKIQLFFTCTIQLCYKHDGGCDGVTPPNCGGSVFPAPSSMPISKLNSVLRPKSDKLDRIPPHGDSSEEILSPPVNRPSEPAKGIDVFSGDKQPKIPDAIAAHIPKNLIPEGYPMPPELRNIENTIKANMQKVPPPPRRPPVNVDRFKGVPYKDSPINETDLDDLQTTQAIRRTNVVYSDAVPDGIITIVPGLSLATQPPTRTTTAGPGESFGEAEELVTPPLHVYSNKNSMTTTKKRRDLDKMETDLSVDMIVLPPQAEENRKDSLAQASTTVCLTRTATILLMVVSLSAIFIAALITFLVTSRTRILNTKQRTIDAFH